MRPKARDKHVDALRQKLSDGGSIPPASTTTSRRGNNLKPQLMLGFFSMKLTINFETMERSLILCPAMADIRLCRLFILVYGPKILHRWRDK